MRVSVVAVWCGTASAAIVSQVLLGEPHGVCVLRRYQPGPLVRIPSADRGRARSRLRQRRHVRRAVRQRCRTVAMWRSCALVGTCGCGAHGHLLSVLSLAVTQLWHVSPRPVASCVMPPPARAAAYSRPCNLRACSRLPASSRPTRHVKIMATFSSSNWKCQSFAISSPVLPAISSIMRSRIASMYGRPKSVNHQDTRPAACWSRRP